MPWDDGAAPVVRAKRKKEMEGWEGKDGVGIESQEKTTENKQLKPSAAGEKRTTAVLCCNNYKLWSLSKIAWLKSNIVTRFNIGTS